MVYYAEQAVPVLSPSSLSEIILGTKGEPEADFPIVIVTETPRGLLGFGCDRVVHVERQSAKGPAPREAGTAPGAPGRPAHELDWDKILLHLD